MKAINTIKYKTSVLNVWMEVTRGNKQRLMKRVKNDTGLLEQILQTAWPLLGADKLLESCGWVDLQRAGLVTIFG